MGVLSRTRLTAYLDLSRGEVRSTARTSLDCCRHTSDDVFPVLSGDARGLVVAVHRIEGHSLDGVHNVGAHEVPSIGDGGGEVSYL